MPEEMQCILYLSLQVDLTPPIAIYEHMRREYKGSP